MPGMKLRSTQLDLLLYLWYIVFFISLVCCFRAISSIAIGLILITGLLKNKTEKGSWINNDLKNAFLATCFFFYLIQAIPLLFTTNFTEAVKNIQLKSAILLVPIAVCCCSFLDEVVREKLMKYYIGIIAAVLLFCLLNATYRYQFHAAAADVFFYHELVSPFRQHAVQVSIYVFFGLLYLLEKAKNENHLYSKGIHFILIVYFTTCLLLLSSKLIIAFSAVCFVYYAILVLRSKPKGRLIIFTTLFAGLAMITLVLSTQNNISKRFNEIRSGNLALVQQQNFDPGIYFNGLQFRLVQWRFVKEILTERHAWLTGVSSEAQTLLNNKYTSTHMYIGDGASADHGFIGYNTHAQFLESLLQSGIVGLLSFLLICFAMIRMAIHKKNRELSIAVILLIAYCFNESVFESQYGITLFTFFPLFLFYGTKKTAAIAHP